MGVFRSVKNGVKQATKSFLNVKAWVNWESIKTQGSQMKEMASSIFIPKQGISSKRSFDDYLKQARLKESDLEKRYQELKTMFYVSLTISLLIFLYAIYHLSAGYFRSFLASIAVLMIALAFTFRFHFWCFQIKKRKLGCSFKEWINEGLLGKKL